MNQALQSLYSSKWDNLAAKFNLILEDQKFGVKPANPLLLYIGDEEEYKKADIKLMIFGQETNGWYERGFGTIDDIQLLYNGFFNEGDCWSYGGQFWNGVSRFFSSLQKKFPDKKIHLIWNNIVKIGKYDEKGFPPNYIYEIERGDFHVIPNELKILNPNVVLFLTGPNYDSILADNFGKLDYEALLTFSERQLAKVSIDNVLFAFRTYHPNYLWRIGIDVYFDAIVSNINF